MRVGARGGVAADQRRAAEDAQGVGVERRADADARERADHLEEARPRAGPSRDAQEALDLSLERPHLEDRGVRAGADLSL